MKSSARNIQLTFYDDLFTPGEKQEKARENVQEIELDQLFPFKNHPFKVLEDEAMKAMVESIKEYGILVPGLARPGPDGGYELVAGHRRKRASELAGKTVMPVIVREMDEEEAVLAMVDSNLQRENILPSEKAWAYKMKLDAIRRRAGRPSSDNSRQVGENYSVEIISKDSGDSARNIHRYIRLTFLLPEILQMVDDKKLAFNPAVELSYLDEKRQKRLWEQIEKFGTIPSLEQAKQLKQFSQEGRLDDGEMMKILAGGRTASVQVTLKVGRLKQYFPNDYTQQQMEEIIFSLLEKWKNGWTQEGMFSQQDTG